MIILVRQVIWFLLTVVAFRPRFCDVSYVVVMCKQNYVRILRRNEIFVKCLDWTLLLFVVRSCKPRTINYLFRLSNDNAIHVDILKQDKDLLALISSIVISY